MRRGGSIIPFLGKAALASLREKIGADAVRLAERREKSKYGNDPLAFKSTQGFELIAASRAEWRDYQNLDLMIKSGDVIRWVPQVSFRLPGFPRAVYYRCDALVWWANGRVTVRDAKGAETRDFINKRKLMMSTYGLEIELVRARNKL